MADSPLVEIHRIGRHTREDLVGSSACPQLGAHGIALCGLTHAAADYRFCRLRPAKSHVVATTAGRGQVLVDGRFVDARPGSIYLTPLGVPHAFHTARGETWTFAWVSYLRPFVAAPGPLAAEGPAQALWSAIAGLSAEATGPGAAPILTAWADLVHTQACRLRDIPDRVPNRLERLWQEVRTNPARIWTLDLLARRVRIGGEHLRRLCQSEHGVAPMTYVTILRMRRALTLLSHDEMGLQAIAEQIGYETAFSFSAAFKRCFGRPPADVRRQLQAGTIVEDPLDRLRTRVRRPTP